LSLRDSEPYDPECGNCGHPFSFHEDDEAKINGCTCDHYNWNSELCGCTKFGDFAFEPDPVMSYD